VQIEQGEIGFFPLDEHHRLPAGFRFADDPHVRACAKKRGKERARGPLVVCDHHADGYSHEVLLPQ
jgi:hypothetical protein